MPMALATFYPSDNILLEENFNITNATRITAAEFCFNNETCFGIDNLKVVQVNSMFGLALIISILGTSFLFVYIASHLGSATENVKRPIIVIFLNSLKGLLIFSAMLLPTLAITANEAIWGALGIDASRLSIYSTGAYKVALYIPMAIISLIMIFLIVEAVLTVIEKRRE